MANDLPNVSDFVACRNAANRMKNRRKTIIKTSGDNKFKIKVYTGKYLKIKIRGKYFA